MAANEQVDRGIRWHAKKVFSCMLLKKELPVHEDLGLIRYMHFRDIFFFTIGVVLSSFYRGMPRIISEYGYMIFFPLLVSGMMSFITSICFAELVSLNPNSGGAYRYVYYTMGELMGFLVGWFNIYSSFLGVVRKAVMITESIDDNIFDGQVGNFTAKYLPIGGFQNYFIRILPEAQIQTIFLILLLTGTCILGVRYALHVVNVIAIFNIIIIFSCIIIFWFYMDLSKFNIIGATNDFKFFTEGSVEGHLFYVDFDVTLYAGAEAVDPRKTIPNGLVEAFHVGFLIYMSSIILYTAREGAGDKSTTDPIMKNALWNLGFKKFYVLPPIGFILCIFLSGKAGVFEATRVMFTMARDGLLFPFLGRLNNRLKSPLVAHAVLGIICYIVAVFIGIATTTKWSIVAVETTIRILVLIAYLVTRYRCEDDNEPNEDPEIVKNRWVLTNYPNSLTRPTKTTHNISMLLIFLSVITIISAEFIMVVYIIGTNNQKIHLRLAFVISMLIALVSVQLLNQQPVNDRRKFPYNVRGVPYTPILSITWNALILMFLPQAVWIKLFCWLIIGLIFYFTYACLKSEEYKKQEAAKAEVQSLTGISVPEINKK